MLALLVWAAIPYKREQAFNFLIVQLYVSCMSFDWHSIFAGRMQHWLLELQYKFSPAAHANS